jgi:hypothetical protein
VSSLRDTYELNLRPAVQKRWHSEALLEGHTSAPPIWACRVPRKDVTAHVSGKAETWRSPSGWVVLAGGGRGGPRNPSIPVNYRYGSKISGGAGTHSGHKGGTVRKCLFTRPPASMADGCWRPPVGNQERPPPRWKARGLTVPGTHHARTLDTPPPSRFGEPSK